MISVGIHALAANAPECITSDICRVFISYVRPILEYNTPVWNPWLIQDIKCVEGVLSQDSFYMSKVAYYELY